MWSFVSPANLMDFQRRALLESMGETARQLLLEGYVADADRVLDEMLQRQLEWDQSPLEASGR
jgi:hypothetical protein